MRGLRYDISYVGGVGSLPLRAPPEDGRMITNVPCHSRPRDEALCRCILRTEEIAAALRRLHERRVKFMNTSVDKIALGITEDEISLGTHLIHFWQSDAEFERRVRLLVFGLATRPGRWRA